MTVPVEPHGQPNHAPGWLDVLGATIAGTLSVGVNLAGPAWVAPVLGIGAPLVVGFIFPTAGTLLLWRVCYSHHWLQRCSKTSGCGWFC
jgi:hypothetical protein